MTDELIQATMSLMKESTKKGGKETKDQLIAAGQVYAVLAQAVATVEQNKLISKQNRLNESLIQTVSQPKETSAVNQQPGY